MQQNHVFKCFQLYNQSGFAHGWMFNHAEFWGQAIEVNLGRLLLVHCLLRARLFAGVWKQPYGDGLTTFAGCGWSMLGP